MNPIHTFPPYFFKIIFSSIFPSVPKASLQFSKQNSVFIYHLYHACCMPCPSHTLWFDHPSSIWWSVQTMKHLIMHFSNYSCYFLLLRSKYSCQHPVLKLILCYSLMWETKFYTHMKEKISYNFIYYKDVAFVNSTKTKVSIVSWLGHAFSKFILFLIST